MTHAYRILPIVAALTVISLLSPVAVLAVFDSPSSIIQTIDRNPTPNMASVTVHGHAEKIWFSAWISGVREGLDPLTMKANFKATMDIDFGTGKIRAKLEVRMKDGTMWARLESVEGNWDNEAFSSTLNFFQKKWIEFPLKDLEISEEDSYEFFDNFFTMERAGTHYELRLKREMYREIMDSFPLALRSLRAQIDIDTTNDDRIRKMQADMSAHGSDVAFTLTATMESTGSVTVDAPDESVNFQDIQNASLSPFWSKSSFFPEEALMPESSEWEDGWNDGSDDAWESVESGDIQTAISQLEHAAKYAPDDRLKIGILKNLGNAYISDHQNDKALATLKDALTLVKEGGFDHHLLSGEIALLQQDHAAALASFNLAYELNATDLQLNSSLARFYLDMKDVVPQYVDYKKALFYALRAYEYDVFESFSTKENLIIAHFFNANYDEAISLISTINLDQHPHMAFWLGRIYLSKGDHDNAQIYFQQARDTWIEMPQVIIDYLE